MTNFDKIVKEDFSSDFFIRIVAEKRIEDYNKKNNDNPNFDHEYYQASDGNQYYWFADAVKAEIKWLKQEYEDDEYEY